MLCFCICNPSHTEVLYSVEHLYTHTHAHTHTQFSVPKWTCQLPFSRKLYVIYKMMSLETQGIVNREIFIYLYSYLG